MHFAFCEASQSVRSCVSEEQGDSQVLLQLGDNPRLDDMLHVSSQQQQNVPVRLNFAKHKGRQDDRSKKSTVPVAPAATQKVHALLADLKSCSKKRDLQWGRSLHANAVQCGTDSHIFVATALVKMYAKCGSMASARQVFNSIAEPDVVSWTALLLGYADNGEGEVALELFSEMKARGVCEPNCVTYLAVLKACTSLAVAGDDHRKSQVLDIGRKIESEIGCHTDFYVQSTLIEMYAKCGSMVGAHRVFDSIHNPDVLAWTAVILGYAENGEGLVALEMFSKMKTRGCAPDSVTYVAALKACTSLALNGDDEQKAYGLELSRDIYSEAGCHLNLYVQNTLLDMYVKCGRMADAHQLFNTIRSPNVVSWTALLLGCAENGEGHIALQLFSKMKTRGCPPNSVTYVAVLKACTSLAANGDGSGKAHGLEAGRNIHSEISCHLNLYVQSALIDMYAKCNSMAEARKVFESIQRPNVVSWNCLLLGYAENGQGLTTLELFCRMKRVCVPDSVTYVAVLKACGSVGALSRGRKIHSDISEFTSHVVTCLVDFYAKCGSMGESRAAFDMHSAARSVATCNALLAGYSAIGDTASVFDLLKAMQDESFRPDAVTFCCVLLCCSHAGLAEKAREYFKAMPSYGVTPSVMHYTCMVDALGRANQLSEAIAVMRKMPCNPDAAIWMTLFGACRHWKNVKIGACVFQSLMEMDKTNASAYVLMAHIYGSLGMWEEQHLVLQSRKRASI